MFCKVKSINGDAWKGLIKAGKLYRSFKRTKRSKPEYFQIRKICEHEKHDIFDHCGGYDREHIDYEIRKGTLFLKVGE